MLPSFTIFRGQLKGVIADKQRQGHATDGLADELRGIPDSYDALWAFAQRLRHLPLRADWPWHEPSDLPGILLAADPGLSRAPIAAVDPVGIRPRVEQAFLSAVCGCILGKPLEISQTGQFFRAKLEPRGSWPLRGYISEADLAAIGKRHGDAAYTTRETITYAGPDDDLNYTLIGMLLLERHGADFTTDHLRDLWFTNIPSGWQWGPERTVGIKAALHSLMWSKDPVPYDDWVEVANAGDEACGAQIRADAYGYACPGHPFRAACLAYRDAAYTHRRTGIYATMWTAAAIATAFVSDDWKTIAATANQYIPVRSRFHACVAEAIAMVDAADDWWQSFLAINQRWNEYGHCGVYQEVATLINTLKFATSPHDGFCKQVMQGNDTDSYGCTAGSLCGAKFPAGTLDRDTWVAPFQDTIHTTIATLTEHRLSALATRMAALPAKVLG